MLTRITFNRLYTRFNYFRGVVKALPPANPYLVTQLRITVGHIRWPMIIAPIPFELVFKIIKHYFVLSHQSSFNAFWLFETVAVHYLDVYFCSERNQCRFPRNNFCHVKCSLQLFKASINDTSNIVMFPFHKIFIFDFLYKIILYKILQ